MFHYTNIPDHETYTPAINKITEILENEHLWLEQLRSLKKAAASLEKLDQSVTYIPLTECGIPGTTKGTFAGPEAIRILMADEGVRTFLTEAPDLDDLNHMPSLEIRIRGNTPDKHEKYVINSACQHGIPVTVTRWPSHISIWKAAEILRDSFYQETQAETIQAALKKQCWKDDRLNEGSPDHIPFHYFLGLLEAHATKDFQLPIQETETAKPHTGSKKLADHTIELTFPENGTMRVILSTPENTSEKEIRNALKEACGTYGTEPEGILDYVCGMNRWAWKRDKAEIKIAF